MTLSPCIRPSVTISVSSEYRQSAENLVFERQFAGTYFVRYHNLRQTTAETAKRQWPDVQMIESLKEAKNAQGKVAVVGTVYKEGKLKPNVLEELQKFSKIVDQQMVAPEIPSLICDTDVAYLEDPESRVQLGGANFRTSEICTGLVIAVCGEFDTRGVFQVDSWTLPGAVANRSIADSGTSEKSVLFVSGLKLGQERGAASMLLDWILGLTEDPRASEICAVVIAGNSVLSDFLPVADAFFTSLASVVPVIVLPGDSDPANFALPQQPIHSAIFGRAKTYKNLFPTTNPARFDLDDRVKCLGSAGQGVREIQWYTEHGVFESLQLSLVSRLLAPTAPDTLACYPVAGEVDTLVIREGVDVFFAGNCKETTIGKVDNTLVLGLSVFAETGEAVLLNLRSMDTEIVEFRTD